MSPGQLTLALSAAPLRRGFNLLNPIRTALKAFPSKQMKTISTVISNNPTPTRHTCENVSASHQNPPPLTDNINEINTARHLGRDKASRLDVSGRCLTLWKESRDSELSRSKIVYDPTHPDTCECVDCVSLRLEASYDAERQLWFETKYPGVQYHTPQAVDLDETNWSSLSLQLSNRDHTKWPLRHRKLGHLAKKTTYNCKNGEPGYWTNLSKWRNFDSTASILACAKYDRAESFLYCGNWLGGKMRATCHNTNFCPRCCHNDLAKPYLEEFEQYFKEYDEILFFTLCITRKPNFRSRFVYRNLNQKEWKKVSQRFEDRSKLAPLPLLEDVHCFEVREYWRIFSKVMRKHCRKRLIGAFGRHELAVQFEPNGALPNSHYMGFAQCYSVDFARELMRDMKKEIDRSKNLTDKLYPSVAIYRIQKQDVKRVVNYIFKPLPLEKPYKYAVMKKDNDSSWIAKVNQRVNRFLESLDFVTMHVVRTQRFGACFPKNGKYWGRVSEKRLERREKDRDRRLLKRAQQKERMEADPDYKPAKKLPLSKAEKIARMQKKRWELLARQETGIPKKSVRRRRRSKRKPSGSFALLRRTIPPASFLAEFMPEDN